VADAVIVNDSPTFTVFSSLVKSLEETISPQTDREDHRFLPSRRMGFERFKREIHPGRVEGISML